MAAAYLLDRRGIGVQFPLWARDIFLNSVQTVSCAHLASCPVGNGDAFSGLKRLGREAYHSYLSSAEVKNVQIYISTHLYILMSSCRIKHRDFFLAFFPEVGLCDRLPMSV